MKERESKIFTSPSASVHSIESNQKRIKIWTWVMIVFWSLSITSSFFWNDQQVHSLIMEQAGSELRASFFKDLTFRQWATKHGGVYVPVTEETQPDPYIDYLPERDVTTPSGRVLTLINPALMVRMFNEMAQKNSKTQGHISSLRPINLANKPDPWEAIALKRFEENAKEIIEVTEVSEIDGNPYLRLIHVLTMNEQCLVCHQQQGYKLDDVAGGVSVSVPLLQLERVAYQKIVQIGLGHSVLWAIGLMGILLGSRRLIHGDAENSRAYIALQENETRTRDILSTSLDAVITIDEFDVVTGWNHQAELIFGWVLDDAIGKQLAELIIPEQYRKKHLEGIQRFLKTGKGKVLSTRMEVTALKRDGTEFPVELTIAPILIDGRPAFSSFIRDISEQKKAAEQINNDYHSQRVIATVLEISSLSIPFKEKLEQCLDAILSTPWLTFQGKGLIFTVEKDSDYLLMVAQRGISGINQTRCNSVKFGDCLCGRAVLSEGIVFTSGLDESHDMYEDCMKEYGHYCVPIKADNQILGVMNLYLNYGHEINQDELNYLESIANTLGNIIRQNQHEERLEKYAYYDELTNLPNRTLFIDRLDQCIKHKKRHQSYLFSVLFLDLDRFKNVNDSLGHAVGDQVLNHVAERLQHCVRQIDTVARLGGDEFAILLDDIDDMSDAYHTAGRIHKELVDPLQLERHEVFTSTSIGIVPGLVTYDAHSDLLRDADIAMYRAKQKGNGHTEIFDEEMHALAVNTLNMETELRRAIERKEFCLHLQPIISIKYKRIVGFESLLRWNNPERGLIYPDDFIVIAEETGLINEIGTWVLQESCRLIKLWNDSYPEHRSLYVSVNVSSVQFLKKDLVTEIDRHLKSISFDNNNLRLEVTESALMKEPAAAAQILRDLSSRNIRLYLDDFGTGYSSLSYIHNYPFNTLKIDRSFISKMMAGEEHVGMVKTIIAVAKNFNMDIIAEGVECKEQLLMLEEMGCFNIQGYYFSEPVPVVDAEKMLVDYVYDTKL